MAQTYPRDPKGVFLLPHQCGEARERVPRAAGSSVYRLGALGREECQHSSRSCYSRIRLALHVTDSLSRPASRDPFTLTLHRSCRGWPRGRDEISRKMSPIGVYTGQRPYVSITVSDPMKKNSLWVVTHFTGMCGEHGRLVVDSRGRVSVLYDWFNSLILGRARLVFWHSPTKK